MRLKEIKPGMVIHCKSLDEQKALYDELCRIGNMKTDSYTGSLDYFTDADCNYRIGNLKRETWCFTTEPATVEFSDLIIHEMSAEEVLQICAESWNGSECLVCPFGEERCFNDKDTDKSGIVAICGKWKSDHEKKEPEIEWFWKSYVVGGSDYKEADTEQEAMEWCEYYVKEHPDAKCIYKRVCRIKAVE